MKKKVVIIGLLLIMFMTLIGCSAIPKNDKSEDGSFFGTNAGDYIVVNYVGHKIMDVWKLKNTIVSRKNGVSDGWNFVDSKGNVQMLSVGNVKVTRIKDLETYNAYKEYHYEIDGGDYNSFLNESKK